MLKGALQPHRRKKTLWTAVAALAIFVFAISAAFFFKEYQDIKKDPSAANEATSQRIIDKVAEIYLLPADEKPTVAKIEDKSKLGGQIFFNSAENGDYLLVYPKAKIALLYREQHNKLVNVGPVNTDQPPRPEAGGVAGEQADTP